LTIEPTQLRLSTQNRKEKLMRTIAIALLATTVIGTPAIAASNNQQPQTKQMQPQNNAQGQTQGEQNGNAQQNAQGQRDNQQNSQQQAQNQPIAPNRLQPGQVRQVQQALDKDGFKAGKTDGRWGPETANAVKQFQQSKQIQSNGRLDQQTIADLGLDASRFEGAQK
jgi:hypothetical protein